MDIIDLLAIARERNASDLHLIAGSPALFRIYGVLHSEEGDSPLTQDDMEHFLGQLTSEEERKEFYRCFELDFGYTVPEIGRVR